MRQETPFGALVLLRDDEGYYVKLEESWVISVCGEAVGYMDDKPQAVPQEKALQVFQWTLQSCGMIHSAVQSYSMLHSAVLRQGKV